VAASAAARVILKAGRDKALRDGHPWVFSGAVEREEGTDGAALVEVVAASGTSLGVGLFSPRSQIRVRMLASRPQEIGQAFFAERLAEAAALRRAILPPETTGYRVLNAEGDGVPGWTVDRYGDVLVSQITASGLEALRAPAYAALLEAFPGSSILQVNDLPARRIEELPQEDEVIEGSVAAEAPFTESGFALTADLHGGQKTGYYCDQRENRRLAERLAAGRSVLDLFAYTGPFGLYALRGGATSIRHVESSERLIERGKSHYAANFGGDDLGRVAWSRHNVFEDLRARKDRFGLVLCDPPPLVKKRNDLDAAARAYKDLNRLALARVEPGGFLLTFTCSGAVDTKLFRQILFAAAVEAGVRANLLTPLAASPDHPVAITHPQGEYLKGWLIEVRGPAV
jgi:23S rRNA (cytosine1962-C5)-methyltransferase